MAENGRHKDSRYVSIPILFVFIILLSLLSYQYFERPMNRKVKQLLG